MTTTILEPLRWAAPPARVAVCTNAGGTEAYYQVISPRHAERLCLGRPVEEVPRILTILSPTHHLVSAMALDNLFEVEPPPPAVHMRTALLRAQFFRHHIRTLYFFLSASEDPFREPGRRQVPRTRELAPRHVLEEMKHHEALAQEAEAILGGRPDHPVSAIVGGVGRFLKEPHYDRLNVISGRCLEFAVSTAALMNDIMSRSGGESEALSAFALPSMPFMASSPVDGTIVLRDPDGKEIERFAPENIFDKIGLEKEPWTYEPFAYVKSRGRQPVFAPKPESFFFVGPLARLNSGDPLPFPLAEEERQRMIADLGAGPHFSLGAAYRAMAIELIGAAEGMTDLFGREQLTGPSIRTLPSHMNRTGVAALEAPEGLIAHRYEVDERGIVGEIQVLDTTAENNALRCLLVRKTVEAGVAVNMNPKDTKGRIEAIMLPF